MRALGFTGPGGPEVVRDVDVPEPVAGPGEILVDVRLSALNFMDSLLRTRRSAEVRHWPYVPGREVFGTVAAVGDGVEGFRPGDRVVSFLNEGGLAERVAASAQLSVVVPAGLDPAVAAVLPLSGTTAAGLIEAGRPRRDDTVLVTSAGGGIGAILAALLVRRGATTVFGAAGSEEKAAGLAPLYRPLVRGSAAWRELLDGAAVDVAYESVGGTVRSEAAAALGHGGRLVAYGAATGQPEPDDLPGLAALRAQNQQLIGFTITGWAGHDPLRVRGWLEELVTALAEDATGFPVPRTIPWAEARAAHLAQERGELLGKVVVAVGDEG